MAEAMWLLVDVAETLYGDFYGNGSYDKYVGENDVNYDLLTEDCRENPKLLKKVHNIIREDAEEALMDHLCDAVAWTREQNGDKLDFLPGFLYPGELVERAESWNKELVEYAEKSLKKFLDRIPDGRPMSEYLMRLADFTGDKSLTPEESLLLYNIRHSLNALDGVFAYGDGRYVMDREITNAYTAGIPQRTLESVKAHPEWYAILLVTYDA